jgi:hypothetical protein
MSEQTEITQEENKLRDYLIVRIMERLACDICLCVASKSDQMYSRLITPSELPSVVYILYDQIKDMDNVKPDRGFSIELHDDKYFCRVTQGQHVWTTALSVHVALAEFGSDDETLSKRIDFFVESCSLVIVELFDHGLSGAELLLRDLERDYAEDDINQPDDAIAMSKAPVSTSSPYFKKVLSVRQTGRTVGYHIIYSDGSNDPNVSCSESHPLDIKPGDYISFEPQTGTYRYTPNNHVN